MRQQFGDSTIVLCALALNPRAERAQPKPIVLSNLSATLMLSSEAKLDGKGIDANASAVPLSVKTNLNLHPHRTTFFDEYPGLLHRSPEEDDSGDDRDAAMVSSTNSCHCVNFYLR